MTDILAREQARLSQYTAGLIDLRRSCFDREHPVGAACDHFVREFGAAVGQFGVCELHMRQAERWQAAGLMPEAEAELRARAGLLNDRGLELLADAVEALSTVRDALGEVAPLAPGVGLSFVTELKPELCFQLASLEIKPADVTKLLEAFENINAPIADNDLMASVDQVHEWLMSFDEARRRPDRGVIDNIPWWKVAAIVAFYGAIALAKIYQGGIALAIAIFGGFLAILIACFC